MTLPGQITNAGSVAQHIAAVAAKAVQVDLLVGVVQSVGVNGDCAVSIGGVILIPAQWACSALPSIGDNVLLARQNGVVYGLTPISGNAMPSVGTVSSIPANSYTVNVSTSAGTVAANWVASYTPVVSDIVYLGCFGTAPIIVGKQGKSGTGGPVLGVSPPALLPTPPSIIRPSIGISTFPASSVGTYQAGKGWLDPAISNGNVMQGDPGGGVCDGAFFYGGTVASTLAGVTVVSARIYLGRGEGGAAGLWSAWLSRVTNLTQPAGALTFSGSTVTQALAPGREGWFEPAGLTALAQSVVDSDGSIGVVGAGHAYMRLYGLAQSGAAGTLEITWTR